MNERPMSRILRFDAWREAQPDKPSRSETIRRLVKEALRPSDREPGYRLGDDVGAAKNKRERILQSSDCCYFCGIRPPTTIDHVPSRECFRDRIGPDGFEFPACSACNEANSREEQIAATYIHWFNFEDRELALKQLNKLLTGLANNDPDALFYRVGSVSKRQAVREGKLLIPPGQSYRDLPVVGVGNAVHAALRAFSRKLTCALYFKHAGKPMPIDAYITTQTLFWSETRTADIVKKFSEMLPSYERGARVNTDIGEQFHYKYGHAEDADIFAFIAQFPKSIFINGVATVKHHADMAGEWAPHSEDLPAAIAAVQPVYRRD